MTSPRRGEVWLVDLGMAVGVFDAQNLVTIPHAKLSRSLGNSAVLNVRPLNERDLASYLKQAVQHRGEFLIRGPAKPLADALRRERANLADLDPRTFRQLRGLELKGQRVSGPRLLAGQGHRDDGAGPLIEDVVAQHQDRTLAGLLVAAYEVEVGPSNLAPQYSGHGSRDAARPSSASCCSSAGSSLVHSSANRVRARRASFSASAVSMAWLRLRNRRRATRSSTRFSRSASIVRATLVLGIVV